MNRGGRALLSAIIPLSLACAGGDDGGDTPATAARDSAGVRIVENVAPAWGEGEGRCGEGEGFCWGYKRGAEWIAPYQPFGESAAYLDTKHSFRLGQGSTSDVN